jgi:Lrp/AsnC family transcriptional regulator, leucine-responsive regulatory protein
MLHGMDDRDRRILAELEADAWLSYAALAERVHLSASAVQRRVEKLLAAGVLLGAHARIADDRETLIYVLVELRDDTRATLRGFAESMRASPLVDAAHYVTGDVDVVLTLRVTGVPEYAAFVEQRLTADSRVRRFRTLTRIRTLA